MQKLIYVIMLVFVVAMGSACKDTCEKAAEVTEDKCGLEVDTEDPDDDDEEVECSGDAEAFSTCVIENADAYCEWLDDVTTSNDFSECIAE